MSQSAMNLFIGVHLRKKQIIQYLLQIFEKIHKHNKHEKNSHSQKIRQATVQSNCEYNMYVFFSLFSPIIDQSSILRVIYVSVVFFFLNLNEE
jgi:hypothetical protein